MTFSSTIRSFQACTALVLATLLLAIVPVQQARGQWAPNGVPVCTAPNGQGATVITTDGTGGAFIFWEDGRNGSSDVYGQRVNSAGFAVWAVDGIGVCVAPGVKQELAVVADGSGGAIVVWADDRAGAQDNDIYTQRVNAAGAVLWTGNGVPVCTATGEQRRPVIVADGTGGAVIVWDDKRNGASNADIYAQRIDAQGNVGWIENGISLCSSPLWQTSPFIGLDGVGGAVVAWEDGRSGYEDGDLFAQRITFDGNLLWSLNGVPVCEYGTAQVGAHVIPDGTGGVIIAWQDFYGILWEQSSIYAQRLSAAGAMIWPERGVAMSTSGDSFALGLSPDDAGGAIAVWWEATDVLAQRIDPTGNSLWTSGGVPVCNVSGEQYRPVVASDLAGGVIVAWQDDGPGLDSANVGAGRIDPMGNVPWGSQGIPVCTAANDQTYPSIVSDGGGGAIIAWSDGRNAMTSGYDIYAQRIGPEGLVPTTVARGARTPGLVVSPGTPNPFSGGTRFDVVLETESSIDVRVYDVLGRQVRRELLDAGPAGTRTIEFDGRDDNGRPLPGGVYFCRVTAGGSSAVLKLTIAR